MRIPDWTGEYFKPKDKFEALNLETKEIRLFEKRDYAFKIMASAQPGTVVINYQGTMFEIDREIFEKKCKPALHHSDLQEYLILKYISGSRAYGTNIPTSDTDYKAVFVLPDYVYAAYEFDDEFEEVHEKDEKNGSETTYYSLKKFISLIEAQNPNILEVFNIPDDCLVFKHSCIDPLLREDHQSFLTKQCYYTFLSYGESQIQKAQGQDKMQNWEKSRMERKTVLDFCYTFHNQGSVQMEFWLDSNDMEQRFCGLTAVPHMREMYGVYYDHLAHVIVYLKEIIEGTRDVKDLVRNEICSGFLYNLTVTPGVYDHQLMDWYMEDPKRTLEHVKKYGGKMLGYKGIVLDDSNAVRLSETPKGALPICYMSYNKDGYSTHCKDYKRYLTWKEERNEQRWVDVQGHNQKIDGKNMLHCMRLIYMSEDIASGRGIIVRRPEKDYLISIRKGEVDLHTLLEDAQDRLVKLKKMFADSNLRDTINVEYCRHFYHMIKDNFEVGTL